MAMMPTTEPASAKPRFIFVRRTSQLAIASKIAPSTIAANTSMKKRVRVTASHATPMIAMTTTAASAILPGPNVAGGAGVARTVGAGGALVGSVIPPY
jgi:hypothetical protein